MRRYVHTCITHMYMHMYVILLRLSDDAYAPLIRLDQQLASHAVVWECIYGHGCYHVTLAEAAAAVALLSTNASFGNR